MKLFRRLGQSAVLAGLLCSVASAAVLLDVTSALKPTDPTQLGRLSRAQPASDWSTQKPFPGIVNPTVSYHFETFIVNVGITPFIQITVDDPAAATFTSAYLNAYLPNPTAPNRGLDTNYRGDLGASGDFFGTEPTFFQVIIPQGNNLVVVVNDVSNTNGGLGIPFHILVEGFTDSEFTEPTPEPAAMLLSATGFGALALVGFLRRKRSRA
jgi:hypothetical protein